MSDNHTRKHGMLRGLDNVTASSTMEGRFGRMFRTLPKAHFTDAALKALASAMSADKEAQPTPETQTDDEENSGISAGYTYFGQFIDHDITFDPASSLQKQNDPNSMVDFRTPRFDLDNVYGRGPDDQPFLYEKDGKKFVLGRPLKNSDLDKNTRDLPRNSPATGDRRATIGDPRNDENVIVSQLQGIFLRFHNRMIDLNPGADFETVQRLVRWHYQWVVLHDFLPTIIGKEMLEKILPHLKNKSNIHEDKPELHYYKWTKEPFMPVEFSVAAYRFGHSMVRPIYRLNQVVPRFEIFSNDPNTSLTGFREFNDQWAIDWRLFFTFPDSGKPNTPQRIQPAYKIDSSLVNPLANLPTSIASGISSLPLRNLLRGNSMGLPSGQDVAKKLQIPVVGDKELRVGKANADGQKTNKSIVDIDPSFKEKAPLWFYILAESQQQFVTNNTPIHLGPVGGRIVGEVFIGLMLGDSHSFLVQEPTWQPKETFLNARKEFGIAELITQATQAIQST